MSSCCACPKRRRQTAGPGRTVRLYFCRGPGPDFSERDRALLTLLRPHLHQAYLDAERRRHPVPQLTPRHWDLLRLVAAGHTNAQIARRLGISEGTVRTHLENIYDTAAGLQPHRRRHPRLPRPGCKPRETPLSPRRATFVPVQTENYGHQRSSTGSTTGLRPGHVQVDPLPETTCDETWGPQPGARQRRDVLPRLSYRSRAAEGRESRHSDRLNGTAPNSLRKRGVRAPRWRAPLLC